MNNCTLLQQVQSTPVASPSSVRPLKVLVVEDYADMLRLYQTVLPAWHLSLDLNIPGIDGLKVLKETMWQAGLTTVVVSGLDEDRIHILGASLVASRCYPNLCHLRDSRQLPKNSARQNAERQSR